MKVKFQTIYQLPKEHKFSREFPSHKKIAIPLKGDSVIFEMPPTYIVKQVVYNYAMDTIMIWLDSGVSSNHS